MTPANAIFARTDPPSSVVILNVSPIVDCGRYPIKREVGDVVRVSADIFKDGHDLLAAFVRYRPAGIDEWSEVEMQPTGNDHWEAEFTVLELGRYEYTIVAAPDPFATWRDEVTKKSGAGLDLSVELLEGRILLDAAAERSPAGDERLHTVLEDLDRLGVDQARATELLLSDRVAALMREFRTDAGGASLGQPLEVIVDRVKARFAAWYEIFPRSAGRVERQSGTFDDVIARLTAIQAMGFDVLYFPPIHPIGRVNRKGPNNSLIAGPDDPGVPYAIGNEFGGHDAIEPSLGTLDDFRRLVVAAAEHGLEIALDFAVQAAPDHPWSTSHPEWFNLRPDGTIKYAENPPKKYEDIYPINFANPDWQALWDELKRIVLFWVELGVKIFRVDNPHTKPVVFWEWLIAEVQRVDPEVIFLSEAFTRPNVMKTLAKAGFSQSYTYFTWRNFKDEIVEYFAELTGTEVAEYMRGNLFPNTPDILPVILQHGGRPAFKMRLMLATTLSSVYGMYSGYELCENTPVPGKEEYLNSEKYDFKVWDWDRPGNIVDYVTLLNRVRREHAALHEYDNLVFHQADDPNFICYSKSNADRTDHILVVVNLDPFQAHETLFHFPLEHFGAAPGEQLFVTELITGQSFFWNFGTQHVYLDPQWEPALIYSVRRWEHVDFVDPTG